MAKAQSAIEFIILIAFMFFFFILLFSIIYENTSEKNKDRKNLLVKEIALGVQDEINLALGSSEGYSRNFAVPEKVDNQEYTINITEGLVYVKTDDGKYSMALPVANVTGNIQKGNKKIKKENNEIKLNVN